MMVPDENGELVEWSIEAGSPNQMSRKGWSKRSLVPGEKVTVILGPLRDGRPGGSFHKVI